MDKLGDVTVSKTDISEIIALATNYAVLKKEVGQVTLRVALFRQNTLVIGPSDKELKYLLLEINSIIDQRRALYDACLEAKAMYEAQGINEDSRIGGEQYHNLLLAIQKAGGR